MSPIVLPEKSGFRLVKTKESWYVHLNNVNARLDRLTKRLSAKMVLNYKLLKLREASLYDA